MKRLIRRFALWLNDVTELWVFDPRDPDFDDVLDDDPARARQLVDDARTRWGREDPTLVYYSTIATLCMQDRSAEDTETAS